MLLPKGVLKILLLSNIWELISLELETMDCGHFCCQALGEALGVAMSVTSLNNPADSTCLLSLVEGRSELWKLHDRLLFMML